MSGGSKALPRRPFRRRRAARPLVFWWDLDKTYLKSDFDSLRDLVRIPFERPEDKVDAPGVVEVIRSLKRVADARGRRTFTYFLSASPPQIGGAIREKLRLDGVEYDAIIFKDQMAHLMRGRFRLLREQVGYKLGELVGARAAAAPEAAEAEEFLFGDDWESDPIIYSLYADLTAGNLGIDECRQVLVRLGVDPRRREQILEQAGGITDRKLVRRIYINLERRTPPADFRAFGPRLVPTFNYFQTAVSLYQDGVLDLEAVVRVARGLRQRGFAPAALVNSLEDVARRLSLPPHTVARVHRALAGSGLAGRRWRPSPGLREWARALRARLPGRRQVEARSAPAADYGRVLAAWPQRR